MADIWFTSDSHFFHENIIKFTDANGFLIRPGFNNAAEMNDCIVTKWNECVKQGDKVWHLGDVAFKTTEKAKELEKLLQSLHGHKRMLAGNHDNLKNPILHRYFDKIELWKGFAAEGFTCTHIPIPLGQLRDGTVCVHGHIHQNLMADPHYINVCVEHTNYAPIHIDELAARVRRITDA